MPTSLQIPGRLVGTVGVVCLAASALAAGPDATDLAELSLEELSSLQVTSVSRKQESVSGAAAAIYVVTGDDIRASGARSIPEALRLVPGLNVAQADDGQWAVSSRGFNSILADKLEVLLDGRSLYTPLYSGVFWDVQEVPLEDVDRIEVIRGPGATLWGTNAVNGVINIITRDPRDTPGAMVHGGAGIGEKGFLNARYGNDLGERGHYRIYARGFERDSNDGDQNLVDRWRMAQTGVHTSWFFGGGNTLTVQGNAYDGYLRETRALFHSDAAPTQQKAFTDVSGANVLARYEKEFSTRRSLSVQAYLDRTTRQIPSVFDENRHTLDVDFQHRAAWGRHHDIIVGGGYRLSQDKVGNSFGVSWTPDSRQAQWFNLFLQDEIHLMPRRLELTAGSKVEHNEFSGLEMQPSARLAWTPTNGRTLWAAVSRAVRAPSRLDRDVLLVAAVDPSSDPSTVLAVQGNPDFESERLWAYELGGRAHLGSRIWADASLFYNAYDNLRSLEGPGDPTMRDDHVVFPYLMDNQLEGETMGGELAVYAQPAPTWHLRATYSLLEMSLRKDPSSLDPVSVSAQDGSPRHQALLRNSVQVIPWLLVDNTVRFVDELRATGIPSYVEMDARIAVDLGRQIQVAAVGRNLLHDRHREFASGAAHSGSERIVFLTLRWTQ